MFEITGFTLTTLLDVLECLLSSFEIDFDIFGMLSVDLRSSIDKFIGLGEFSYGFGLGFTSETFYSNDSLANLSISYSLLYCFGILSAIYI